MRNIRYKRLMAYLVDIFVISLFVYLLSEINILKPNSVKYNKLSQQYITMTENLDKSKPEELLSPEYLKTTYELMKCSVKTYIIEAVIVLLYFTLFPVFNKNRTIGKQLFKLEVKSTTEKVKWYQHLFRSLLLPIWSSIIIYNNIYTILNIILLYVFKDSLYVYVSSIVTFIISIYCYVDIIVLLVNKKGRSLHDMMTKTLIEER